MLDTPVEKLKYVGPRFLPKLKKLGIKNIRDLLYHFPIRYEDYTETVKISDLEVNRKISLVAKVSDIENKRAWKKRMVITNALLEDETGSIKATWFNQPYLVNTLKAGGIFSFSGKVSLGKQGAYLSHPSYERIYSQKLETNLKHTQGLIPIYPETEGITSKYLRFLIKPLLKYASKVPDYLPKEIKQRQNLIDTQIAISQIHFPQSQETAEKAKERLAFDELFLLQLKSLIAREKIRTQKAIPIKFNEGLIKNFVGSLPFKLTNAQRLSLWEIIKDIEKPYPMNRLLNGDVGSGKTVVASGAALEAATAGYQAAFMAPTEVLAFQHFKTISKSLSQFDVSIGLLTSSNSKVSSEGLEYELPKKKLVEKINNGEIKIVIGTHALIQKEVSFPNLALVIVDEQHRFGVEQRATLLRNSSYVPHLLSMTATPIPRTLALTIYGDLDISLLNEMPKGRQKIITKLVTQNERQKTYDFIKEQIKDGRQAFVICPRIDPQSQINADNQRRSARINLRQSALTALEVKAVKSEYEKLSKEIFPDLKVAMLHGKLKPKEKTQIMDDFKSRKYDILVATSVIEVGVDVPNATIMMIEGAEKFGLAQLHQFRGRVGRGDHQSYCLLFIESPLVATTRRLDAIVEHNDGFKLAEMDLKIRGPGEFIGSQQSGMPDLAMASLSDVSLIKKARAEAELLLNKDPLLSQNKVLAKKLGEFQQTVHFE